MNIVAYLYSVCHMDRVADIVVNSSFATLFLKLVKKAKSAQLRLMAAGLVCVCVCVC
jgi:hypothetical protein